MFKFRYIPVRTKLLLSVMCAAFVGCMALMMVPDSLGTLGYFSDSYSSGGTTVIMDLATPLSDGGASAAGQHYVDHILQVISEVSGMNSHLGVTPLA